MRNKLTEGNGYETCQKFFVEWSCLRFWGLTLHKTWQKTKGGYASKQLTNRSLRFCNSCIVNEHKTKDVQGPRPSYINLSQFVCFFDV